MTVPARLTGLTLAALLAASAAFAAEPAAVVNKVTAQGSGDLVGTVSVAASAGGAVFHVNLRGLPPGPHGFHVHENGDCGPSVANNVSVPAGAAGGHMDPGHAGKHEGPQGAGHMGDLPVLEVAKDGMVVTNVTAPHIKDIEALRGHALVIHAGGDNYADQPAPLGGGGARIACGVFK